MQFMERLDRLNTSQRQAVDEIDGPMMVLAGPGTGKTEILSMRVLNILQKTDTLAENILCVTFTENAANNMRSRLSQFIGKDAYSITIGTYHSLGSDIINRFPEYFENLNLEQPIDELKKHQLVSEIIERLDYQDALKQTRHHIKDLIATISEIKRALLTPDDLRKIANQNNIFAEKVDPVIKRVFHGLKSSPNTFKKAVPLYQSLFDELEDLAPKAIIKNIKPLSFVATMSLRQAMTEASNIEKSAPLSKWKSDWLKKDSHGEFTLKGDIANRRLASLANIMESYQLELEKNGFYDFDDMILRATEALELHPDLRYTLQEQYQYILLDEYQDTNAAQAKLIYLLTDNPINNGRPDVMAVGDDDQAIFAFQGALYSNMVDFMNHYRDTKLVELTENYRSHQDILDTASKIANQIDSKLTKSLNRPTKQLVASNKLVKHSSLRRLDFKSQIAENNFIATEIDSLIKHGVSPSKIAVLAPRHKFLENLVPHLVDRAIPIGYEKRDNILDSPLITHILAFSRLVIALMESPQQADQYWPEILSAEFYNIPTEEIWDLSWQVSDHNRSADEMTTWTQAMLNSNNPRLSDIANLAIGVAISIKTDSCEVTIDKITGSTPVTINGSKREIFSPLKEFVMGQNDERIFHMTSELTVLRAKLRDYQTSSDKPLHIDSLIELVDAYQAADQKMLNTSPYNQSDQSVQLMTTFKAKGLEFEYVFLLSINDQTWGSSVKNNNNKLTLPANLAPTRHSGATEDERLRFLFVAMTRAKHTLYLTNNRFTFSGKQTTPLKYLDERQVGDDIVSTVLPTNSQLVEFNSSETVDLQALDNNWRLRHLPKYQASLKDLLAVRLDSYLLSPTHLNSFLDLVYAGPDEFMMTTILRFPTAPSSEILFGDAIHYSLRWLQQQLSLNKRLPSRQELLDYFKVQMKKSNLLPDSEKLLVDRGQSALSKYYSQRNDIFKPSDKAEVNFKQQSVFIDKAHLTGIIDRLEIDEKYKSITVVDYKTGRPSADKDYKYTRQLYFYKLLVEKSRLFKNYNVTGGRIEYIEPDDDQNVVTKIVNFDKDKEIEIAKVIQAVWRHIINLDMPDISSFDKSAKGIKDFEKYLLASFE